MSRNRRRRRALAGWRYSERCQAIRGTSGYHRIYLHPEIGRDLDRIINAGIKDGWLYRQRPQRADP